MHLWELKERQVRDQENPIGELNLPSIIPTSNQD